MDKCSQKVKLATLIYPQTSNCIQNAFIPLPLTSAPTLVVAFPAAPTPSPSLADPSVPSYLGPGAGVEELPDPAGTVGLALDSEPDTETHGAPEQHEDLQQQQMPRQIRIQQHLKLHFHPQGKFWRTTFTVLPKYSQMINESLDCSILCHK